MTESGQNNLQRLATPAMEAESRAWMVQCPHCGAERSVWETGWIRYRAAGTSRRYLRCFACKKRGWHKIYWAGGVPGAAAASAGFVIRLVLGLVVGILLATALVIYLIFKLSRLI